MSQQMRLTAVLNAAAAAVSHERPRELLFYYLFYRLQLLYLTIMRALQGLKPKGGPGNDRGIF